MSHKGVNSGVTFGDVGYDGISMDNWTLSMDIHTSPAAVVCRYLLTTLLVISPAAAEMNTPSLMLARVYHDDIDLEQYWVSEKLDGVRARWDGKNLISRQGNPFNAPLWFVKDFPSVPLDGELWMGRGTFEKLSGAVRRQQPEQAQWRAIRLMVFDLPASPEVFDLRLQTIRRIVRDASSPYLGMVEQFRVGGRDELMQRLKQVISDGGEGLMLHRGGAIYKAGRTHDLLKLKVHQDAEAVVVGHLPGKGKLSGMLGSLLVETPDGLRFRIGTGFSNRERQNPPPLGTTITYRYYGKTGRGVPRFASFMRIRDE
ncbi:MAG: DNA ligase [Gammaproteobacteria bacterium]